MPFLLGSITSPHVSALYLVQLSGSWWEGKKNSKEKDVCLLGATRWQGEQVHSVLPFSASDSRHMDYPDGWTSCAPITLQVQVASTQLSWVVRSTMLAGLHQSFGMLLQYSWVTSANGWLGSFVPAGPHQVSDMHTSVTFKAHTTVRVQALANL